MRAPRDVIGSLVDKVKRRGRDVASTMSLQVVQMATLLVLFPIIIRELGPEVYGEYTVLYLVFGLLTVWVFAGVTASVVQMTLQLGWESRSTLRLAQRQLLMMWAPFSLVGTAVAVVIVGVDQLVPALLVVMADLLLTGLFSLNASDIFAVDGIARSVKVRMVQPVLRTVGVLGFALFGQVTLLTLVGVNVISSAIVWAITEVMIRRRPVTPATGIPGTSRQLFRYSWYYSTSMSTNAVQDEGEKFVLASYRPEAEVGEYAAAYKVVQVSLVPLGAMMGAASRWFMVKDDRLGAQLTRTRNLSIVAAAYGTVVGAAILVGGGLVEWVVGPQYPDAGTITTWLFLFPLLHGLTDLPVFGLLGLGRNRARMLMGLLTSGASIVFYLLLVPHFGWRGAVIGTYLSELGAIILGWILLVRYQRVADQTLRRQELGSVDLATS